MDISKDAFARNYFELFQLPATYEIDLRLLSERYRQLQAEVHPDKFAGASEHEKRLSLQWATHVNAGHEVLRSGLHRAIYLLTLNGIEIADNPRLEPAFLMEQIALREKLEDIEQEKDIQALDAFRTESEELIGQLEAEFGGRIAKDPKQAEETVYKLQFITKLRSEADRLEEILLDY